MEDRRGVGETLRFLRAAGILAETGKSLKVHTTIQVGGEVSLWVEPYTEDEVKDALSILKKNLDLPILVLGRGSNLVVCDGLLPRAVIYTGRLRGVELLEGGRLQVKGGTPFSKVLSFCCNVGLSGLEPLSGIPATVGGMVAMNAGSFGRYIGELVSRIRLITFDVECRTLMGSQVDWGYRHTSLRGAGVITEVELQLSLGNGDAVRREMDRFRGERKERQPINLPSAGSIFKIPAIWLQAP